MKRVRVRVCSKCKSMFWKNKKINPVKVKDFEVEVEKILCKGCEPKPFQALVQLRGFGEVVLGDFEKSLKKIVEVRNGFDLQFASSRSANAYFKWLKKRIPHLEVKRTRSHVTTKEGRKVYRPTICLRKSSPPEK